jgi:cell wall-associated NlpC family hydrolase
MRAAFAAAVVLLMSAGLAAPTALHASNAASAQASSVQVSSDQASFAQASSALASFRATQASSALASFRATQASSRVAAAAAVQVLVRVWRYAVDQRGKPYIWGGTGPRGYDCSGLVYAAYRAAGIVLPRTTYEMLRSARLIRIAKSQAQRGDLAFFGTGHVELYDSGELTYGAQEPGTVIGFHGMNAFWQPTMYFRVRL